MSDWNKAENPKPVSEPTKNSIKESDMVAMITEQIGHKYQ